MKTIPRGKKARIKLGDIFQIKLPDGRYAYGRVLKDAAVAIYADLSNTPSTPPIQEKYNFIVGLYKDVLESGTWPIIANRPFRMEQEAWPPPSYIKDGINGNYRIYHKGVMRDATEDECRGLERAAVWESTHIIDRILGSDKWHK